MTLTDVVKNVKNNALKVGLAPVVALGMTANTDASVMVTYTPDQIGSVSAPMVGLGETSSDYLLTASGGTATLDKNFNGNNQETGIFGNPNTAQDAASFDDNYMFQLGTDENISKVNLSNGALTAINGNSGVYAGANAFGIGYDPSSNSIGIGNFNGTTMSFSSYSLDTHVLSPLTSFAFDTSAYGTPSGLDFKNGRMIVGTENAPDNRGRPNSMNFLLDMDALTGSIDQYATINGSSDKLQDLLYSDGRLATSYQNGSTGIIHVGDFQTVPEPASLTLLALGALAMYKRRK